jgi:peptidyl-prolyl cis-trans isomerase A (cyclophilin A)
MAGSTNSIENLEDRLFFSVHATRILTDYFDNRGLATFTVSVGLDTSTLTRKSAAIYTAGTDTILGTSDDVKVHTSIGYRKGQLTLRADLADYTPYRVVLRSGGIKDINGLALNGEFNGDNVQSGDAHSGGNYDAMCQPAAKTRARITTLAGPINVGFYKNTPITKSNFVTYTNSGAYDNSIFHRSITTAQGGIDIVQGGGFTLNTHFNSTATIDTHGVTIPNEATNLNTKGTLAMANAGDGTGSSQWFFNVNANTGLDTTTNSGKGSYTVFGSVLDAASQRVLEALLAYPNSGNDGVYPLAGQKTNKNVPVRSIEEIQKRNKLSPKDDLVTVDRIAMLMDVVAIPGSAKPAAVIATPAAVVASTAPAPRATPFLTIKDEKNPLLD